MRTRSSTSTTTRAAPPCTTRPPSRPPPGGPGARWPGLRRRAFRLIAVSSRDNLSRLPGPHRADDRELVPEYSGAHYCEEAGKITQDSARPVRLAGFVVSSGCSHDPNAIGNFCFEVTLGYRRLERGRGRRRGRMWPGGGLAGP